MWCVVAVIAAAIVVPHARAQYAPPPDAYSVTQINSMFGPAVTVEVHRDGSKALVDSSHAALPGGKAEHLRTLYDLANHRNFTWNLLDSSAPCGGGTFGGDWGDPFALSAEMNADLAKQHATPIGAATLDGIATKVFAAETTDGQAKAWVEEKYGLMVRLIMTPKSGAPQTLVETKQFSLARPAASLFVLPAACAAAASAPRVPTEAEQIAADTGGNAQDYANANMPPASKNSCTVLMKVVRAGSLQPLATKYRVAIDTNVDIDHPAHYVIGLSDTVGQSTFAGGGLHEVTGQIRNGVLRIENAPPQFDMELTFSHAGATGLIYRQCFAPQTTLLLVVKNPDKLSDGARWLWVKSGK